MSAAGFRRLAALAPSFPDHASGVPSLPLGRSWEGNLLDDELVHHRGHEGHSVVIGATGRGKSASVVIPWLLSHDGAAVVVDIKGELHARTSAYRATLGPVAAYDPFGVLPAGTVRCSVNPLDAASHERNDVARSFAELVCPVREGHHGYWDQCAQNLLHSMSLNAMAQGSATPSDVLELLASPYAQVMNTLRVAHASSDPERSAAAGVMLGGAVAKETFSCYMLGAGNAAAFLGGRQVRRSLNATTFPLQSALTKAKGTLYVVIPEERLQSHAGLMRLVLSAALRAVRSTPDDPKRNVLFMVDEAGNLGRVPELLTALTLGRAKGIRLLTSWQDRLQMHAVYGDQGRMFLSNANLTMFLGSQDLGDARWVSEMAGEDNRGIPVLLPALARNMPIGFMVAMAAGLPARLLQTIRYWEDDDFQPRSELRGSETVKWFSERLDEATAPGPGDWKMPEDFPSKAENTDEFQRTVKCIAFLRHAVAGIGYANEHQAFAGLSQTHVEALRWAAADPVVAERLANEGLISSHPEDFLASVLRRQAELENVSSKEKEVLLEEPKIEFDPDNFSFLDDDDDDETSLDEPSFASSMEAFVATLSSNIEEKFSSEGIDMDVERAWNARLFLAHEDYAKRLAVWSPVEEAHSDHPLCMVMACVLGLRVEGFPFSVANPIAQAILPFLMRATSLVRTYLSWKLDLGPTEAEGREAFAKLSPPGDAGELFAGVNRWMNSLDASEAKSILALKDVTLCTTIFRSRARFSKGDYEWDTSSGELRRVLDEDPTINVPRATWPTKNKGQRYD